MGRSGCVTYGFVMALTQGCWRVEWVSKKASRPVLVLLDRNVQQGMSWSVVDKDRNEGTNGGSEVAKRTLLRWR